MRYSDEYYDSESGMYYLRARYYDPEIARFISEDSYEGEISDPLSLNRYTYCANNPILYSDPSGNYYIIKNNDGTYRIDRDSGLSLALKAGASYLPWVGGYMTSYIEKGTFNVVGGNSATEAEGLMYGSAGDMVGEFAPSKIAKGATLINLGWNTYNVALSVSNYDMDVISLNLMSSANISTSGASISALDAKMKTSYDFIKANYAYFATTVGNSNLSMYQMDENISNSSSPGKLIDKYTKSYVNFLISQGVKDAKQEGRMFWYYLNNWSDRRDSVLNAYSSVMQ